MSTPKELETNAYKLAKLVFEITEGCPPSEVEEERSLAYKVIQEEEMRMWNL